MSDRYGKIRKWIIKQAKTFDLLPDYAKAVYRAWQDYLWGALLVSPIIVWWLVSNPPDIPAPPMLLVIAAFAWAFLVATYYTWRKERIRQIPKLEFAPTVFQELTPAVAIGGSTIFTINYLQVLPRCISETPVEECQGRLLHVLRWNGTRWESTPLNEPLDLVWSYHDSTPRKLELGVEQRLNLLAISNNVQLQVPPEQNPIKASDVFTVDQDYLFQVRVSGKDCPPIELSIKVRFGQQTLIRVNERLPMPVVVDIILNIQL
jgi:hypothetical protein